MGSDTVILPEVGYVDESLQPVPEEVQLLSGSFPHVYAERDGLTLLFLSSLITCDRSCALFGCDVNL